MTETYRNNGTVCCALIPWKLENGKTGLVMVRRGLPEGYGKLALPGGFQEYGENMLLTVAREVYEETGLKLYPSGFRCVNARTDEYNHNVIFFKYVDPVDQTTKFVHDKEVLEVVVIDKPEETAFPFHTDEVRKFFYPS